MKVDLINPLPGKNMNDKDLQKIIAQLQRDKTALPSHQQVLKARLLARHASQQSFGFRFPGLFASKLTGVFTMKSKLVAGLAVAVLVAGATVLVTVNNQSVSAQELATKAYTKTSQMSPAEIEAKNQQYKQDMKQRLQEAKAAADLKKIDVNSAKQLFGDRNHDPSVKQYLSFSDSQKHQIVIGLDSQGNPVSVYDIEQIRGSSTPSMEVNNNSGSPVQGENTQTGDR